MFKTYDVNNDGMISVQELILVARVWGKPLPPTIPPSHLPPPTSPNLPQGMELNAEQSEVLIRSFIVTRNTGSIDMDISLNFTEFKEVMDYFLQLKLAFDTHDRDHNRLINKYTPSLRPSSSSLINNFSD
jgi:Ca2+-binding EF-hand superfamily protein